MDQWLYLAPEQAADLDDAQTRLVPLVPHRLTPVLDAQGTPVLSADVLGEIGPGGIYEEQAIRCAWLWTLVPSDVPPVWPVVEP